MAEDQTPAPDELPEQPAAGDAREPNAFQVYAAACARLAEVFTEMAEDLRQSFSEVQPADFSGPMAEQARQTFGQLTSAIPASAEAMSDHYRLTGQVNAAMSFAYDELIASGGPDNPDALAHYEEAGRWYTELMTAQRPEGDVPPGS